MSAMLIIFRGQNCLVDLSDQELAAEISHWEVHSCQNLEQLRQLSQQPLCTCQSLWLLCISRAEELDQACLPHWEQELVILLSGEDEELSQQATRLGPRVLWTGPLPCHQLAEILRRMRIRLEGRMQGDWENKLRKTS